MTYASLHPSSSRASPIPLSSLCCSLTPAPDYNKAKALTTEASDLARKILDARLQLTRLRQAHPHPRLTVASANAQLDAQVEEMQKLDDELQGLNATIDEVKDRVKEGARDVERLRIERADAEKLVRAGEADVQDGRVRGLYDWCVMRWRPGYVVLIGWIGSRRLLRCTALSTRSSRSSPSPRTSSTSPTRSHLRPDPIRSGGRSGSSCFLCRIPDSWRTRRSRASLKTPATSSGRTCRRMMSPGCSPLFSLEHERGSEKLRGHCGWGWGSTLDLRRSRVCTLSEYIPHVGPVHSGFGYAWSARNKTNTAEQACRLAHGH